MALYAREEKTRNITSLRFVDVLQVVAAIDSAQMETKCLGV